MTIKKKDFIEIEFTGRAKDGEVFDSNIKEELNKINPKIEAKPFIFCIGEDMFLKGIDEFLIGKEIGKYKIELPAEKAFGRRNPKLIQLMPAKIFREHNINPVKGVMFNFDGRIGKVISVTGGRIMVDFNNPVAGKDVVYDVDVKRIVNDKNEQVSAYIDFLFRKDFKFEIKDKKIILEVDKGFKQFVEMFADKFKDVFGMELEVREESEKGKDTKSKKTQNKEEKEETEKNSETNKPSQ